MELTRKTYIGDGVYLGYDEMNRLWIYTSDGYEDTNHICLEPEVIDALLTHIAPLK